MLCGNPNGGCCPSIEDKGKNKGITIVDKELHQKIIFTEEQAQKLTNYLSRRKIKHQNARR